MFDAAFLAVLAMTGSSTASAQAAPPGAFAIVGAMIEIGDGRKHTVGTVVVRNGKIDEVKEGVDAPVGMPLIDGKGKVLYPGFIDGYSTRGLKTPPAQSLPARPDTETTAPSSLWEGHRKGITPEWKASDNLEFVPTAATYRQGLTAGMVSPSRGAMRGSALVMDYLDAEAKERVLKPAAASAFSFRTGSGQGYPTNLLGTISLTRQILLDAKSYGEGVFEGGQKEPPAWHLALKALQPVITGSLPVAWEANMAREVERAVDLAKEFGLKLWIVGGRESGVHAAKLAELKIPVILGADPGSEPSLEAQPATTPPADLQPQEFRNERHARWLASAKSDQALADAGVLFCFSSDSGLGSMLDAVRARIGRGLDREAALKALSYNPSLILGLPDAGLIAAGKKASMVLMTGPFENKESVVERVWVAGRPTLSPEPVKGGAQ
jgi:imidazolonepropionase-like amidohydrolase